MCVGDWRRHTTRGGECTALEYSSKGGSLAGRGSLCQRKAWPTGSVFASERLRGSMRTDAHPAGNGGRDMLVGATSNRCALRWVIDTAECGGHRRPVRHRFPLLAFMRCGSISRPQRNHGQRRSSHRPGPSQVLRQRRPPYNHPVHLQAVSSRFPHPPADVLAMPPSK